MKTVAAEEEPDGVRIPPVLGMTVVRVQPGLAVVITLDVEHVQIAVRIGTV